MKEAGVVRALEIQFLGEMHTVRPSPADGAVRVRGLAGCEVYYKTVGARVLLITPFRRSEGVSSLRGAFFWPEGNGQPLAGSALIASSNRTRQARCIS